MEGVEGVPVEVYLWRCVVVCFHTHCHLCRPTVQEDGGDIVYKVSTVP